MRGWAVEALAAAAGARLDAPPREGRGPEHVTIDSRAAGPGDLFVGLPGTSSDGGAFAAEAIDAGAWGALVSPEHAERAKAAGGAVLVAERPLEALGRLARGWRRELGCVVIGVTGSVGKTSTKDVLAALLAPHRRTHASEGNFNTEIGMPLSILAAERGTEVMVLELAMRGPGQIAGLCEIAEPEVGVITAIAAAHLEQLGTLEAIAAEKGALIAALPGHGTAVVPAGEALLEPHLRADVRTVSFGAGGDVTLERFDGGVARIDAAGEHVELELPFRQPYNVANTLAAVAAARAVGVLPGGRPDVELSGMRGEEHELPGGVVLIDDCYNANPTSMRAALDHLAALAAGRRVAVLGDMLELGARELEFHAQMGRYAAECGVELLVAVGPRAGAIADAFDGPSRRVPDAAAAALLVPELVRAGDTVLVKASRGIALEAVAEALRREHVR